MGPFKFYFYVYDIIKDIESDIFLFADATSIHENITDPVISLERVYRNLSKLEAWPKQWLVNLNPAKTNYIAVNRLA